MLAVRQLRQPRRQPRRQAGRLLARSPAPPAPPTTLCLHLPLTCTAPLQYEDALEQAQKAYDLMLSERSPAAALGSPACIAARVPQCCRWHRSCRACCGCAVPASARLQPVAAPPSPCTCLPADYFGDDSADAAFHGIRLGISLVGARARAPRGPSHAPLAGCCCCMPARPNGQPLSTAAPAAVSGGDMDKAQALLVYGGSCAQHNLQIFWERLQEMEAAGQDSGVRRRRRPRGSLHSPTRRRLRALACCTHLRTPSPYTHNTAGPGNQRKEADGFACRMQLLC